MIVEHVDVKREERERRKREEKRERSRVRKNSRSSRAADVMSVYSLQTPVHTDSGFFSGVRTDSRYSQSIAARPSSVITAGGERSQTLLRARSQASFSDMQSVGSGMSPRRSRFFGLRNLSSGWRSQESFAPSGSMIDMQYVLDHFKVFATPLKYLSIAWPFSANSSTSSNIPARMLWTSEATHRPCVWVSRGLAWSRKPIHQKPLRRDRARRQRV